MRSFFRILTVVENDCRVLSREHLPPTDDPSRGTWRFQDDTRSPPLATFASWSVFQHVLISLIPSLIRYSVEYRKHEGPQLVGIISCSE
jgi:hypothetical protein